MTGVDRRAHARALAAIAGIVAVLAGAGGAWTGAAMAKTTGCAPAGGTGLTTARLVRGGQTVTGTIHAAGCDIGLYVVPGAHGATINGVTVTGARQHAILVEDATNVTIENSLITRNGRGSTPCALGTKGAGACIYEDKPIELVGTSGSVVTNNTVEGNESSGGIGLADDGPIDPGGLRPGAAVRASTGNVVEDNVIVNNAGGCGVSIAAYNRAAGVADNRVAGNTIVGNSAGVVVATIKPHTMSGGTLVEDNIVVDNSLPGVLVHANAPGNLVSGTVILGNTVTFNGPYVSADAGHGPKMPTGIALVAEPLKAGQSGPPARITGTVIQGNTIADEGIAVFSANATGTAVRQNTMAQGDKVVTLP